jgi:hypothetical protein
MNSARTVVVVHDRAAPEARVLLALCPNDLALLRRGVSWVRLDQVVGPSSALACELCEERGQMHPACLPDLGGV